MLSLYLVSNHYRIDITREYIKTFRNYIIIIINTFEFYNDLIKVSLINNN